MTDLYFCPTAREVESATDGGFDTCCAHPELHVPMPDNEATAAVSQALSDAKRREFQAREAGRRLNYRAQQAESKLATFERAVGEWQFGAERGTYVPLRSLGAIAKAVGREIPDRWELHYQRVEAAEAQVARIRAFLEDMAGWCSPHGVAADYAQRGLDALDGIDPFDAIRSKRQDREDTLDAAIAHTALAAIRDYVETSDDDGIRTREHLLGMLDQAGVPSVVAAELGEELPELTTEDAVEAMQDLAGDLYRAEDRLAFVREMCDQADREERQVTTEEVRAWTQYTGCGGILKLSEETP